jgi:hypothetical protein
MGEFGMTTSLRVMNSFTHCTQQDHPMALLQLYLPKHLYDHGISLKGHFAATTLNIICWKFVVYLRDFSTLKYAAGACFASICNVLSTAMFPIETIRTPRFTASRVHSDLQNETFPFHSSSGRGVPSELNDLAHVGSTMQEDEPWVMKVAGQPILFLSFG